MNRVALLFLVLAGSAWGRPEATDDVKEVVKGNNAFAAKLYQQIRGEPGNLIVSPLSISAAVAMTSAGARGDTLSEIEKALQFPGQKVLHPGMGRLLGGYAKRKDVAIANALFGQKGVPWNKGFLGLLGRDYAAAMRDVDFVTDPEQARRTINPWVEKQTRDKIKDLLPRGALDKSTRLVLVNAITFQGEWKRPFVSTETKKADFHVTSTKKVSADLMHKEATFAYHEAGEARVLEVEYAGEDVAIVVVLPAKRHGLAALEMGMTARRLGELLDGIKDNPKEPVRLWLPRFTFTRRIDLKRALMVLGIKTAFKGDADLSGLTESERLFVSDAFHKAHIEVDEKGTKAAAATAVVAKKIEAPREVEFRANEPFLFLIRDKKTGLILFVGRVSDPTAK